MKRYAIEFLGTFFLFLTLACGLLSGSPLTVLAVGAILMVMVYAGGHLSGAHYNPAVTLAIWLQDPFETKAFLGYIASQFLGAIAAAYTAHYLHPAAIIAAKETALPGIFIAELLFTFLLIFVIFQVAVNPQIEGNEFYGVAIGFTLFCGAVAMNNVSSAAFNPAVASALALMGIIPLTSLPVYIVAQLAAAGAAAFFYQWLIGREESEE